jgi:hypothetical protein
MSNVQQKAIAPSVQAGDRSQISFNPDSSRSEHFQHSGRNRPCPICSRTKDGDCRWNDEVVLCHTHVNQDACTPGYVYRGCKDIWGQYFPTSVQPQKFVRVKATKQFIYSDINGDPLVQVTRIDDGAGKKTIFQSRWNGKQWVKSLTPEIKAKLRLYRIADPLNKEAIAHYQPVLLVEGEGKVDVLLGMGIAATCAIGGAGKWKGYGYPNYLEDLAGANVVLCPDLDQPGLAHCLEIEQDFSEAQWLYAFPESPLWQRLPEKGGLDIADWVNDYRLTAEQVLATIEPKRDLEADKECNSQPKAPERQTIAQLLLEIAKEATYFHTSDQKVYADIWANGIRKTYLIRRKAFKQWLQYELFRRHQRTVGSETLSQVLSVIEAKANFEGEVREVHLRIAEHEGKVYLDLGTENWSAVEISSEGWRVVSDYPVRFRRPDTLLPLPVPEANGKLAELQQLLNLDEDAWTLAINWLLFSFYPKYPHPILILHGEQGSGKSYTARVLRALIDPGKAPLIPNVADLRNLAIAAENRWILAYDNLSGLNAEQSDALCRISTGGGFSTRTLYENDEETVFEFIRPQILTGIDSLATRGDLLERALLVKLPAIPEEQRATEAELEARLTRLQGRILGALLTALSQTLKDLPRTNPDRLPRMADFARFAIAAETALDLPVGSFLQVYLGNRQEAHETALDASPVAVAIQRLMATHQHWLGTATELLGELEKLVDEKTVKSRAWAGNGRSLGKALTRLAPDLRGIGIEVTSKRTNSSRFYQIEHIQKQTSQTSLMSQPNHVANPSGDISQSTNVTDAPANVTRDKNGQHHWQTSFSCSKNVTAEQVMRQGLQQTSDKSDIGDMKNAAESNWVGRKVKKRGKLGWVGLVQSVRGIWADVLWQGDRDPTPIALSELEEVA